MFGKLMKYNMKEVGMVMLPIYLAMIALAAALGITQRFSIMRGTERVVTGFVPGMVSLILFIVLGVLTFAMAIVTLVMIEKNFRENLLGKRGYLTNTLPVSTTAHVLGKTVNGTLWLLFGGLAAFASGMIVLGLVFTKSDWAYLQESFENAFDRKASMTAAAAQIILLLLMEGIQIIAKLYVSLAVGNLWRGHRGLGAVLLFVGITIAQTFISNRLSYLSPDASVSYAVMGTGSRMVFGGGEYGGLLTARQLAIQVGGDAACIVLFLVLTILTLKRKLDLE